MICSAAPVHIAKTSPLFTENSGLARSIFLTFFGKQPQTNNPNNNLFKFTQL
jgi:hypothetical protein